jgi:hypothetical protein
MSVLNSTQRGKLEKAVIKARRLSVIGAYNTLKAFAVDKNEPYAHITPEERALRNQLRNKARLLGDHTTIDGGHTIDKLAYELAYEYWHQMLFAQFLEANALLIHPDHEIAVSMEECEELGQEEGFENKWQASANYASKMLPAIFRQDDPLMQLKYATEDRLALEELIESIPEEVFQADDSLGWVYQYWQTEEKERINLEGNKIDGDSISAVTQLFTEPYMVHFLIDNTLGAWWTARNSGVISPYEFKYLRTLEDGTPAAGSFEGWPETLGEITMLDPCMGSGHFVVDVFMAMAQLRMHDENLSKAEACDAVIKENIHGLELDARCTQIAAFNLALAAWKFCGAYRILPEMNLACCGIAPTGKKEDWVKLANSEQDAEKRTRLKGGLERMYDLFQQAPELGSLIDPTIIEKDMYTSDFEELQPFLEAALNIESGDKVNERTVIAAGIAKAGNLLSKKYFWQITNVPYLLRGKQDYILNKFCDNYYSNSKSDLATVFLEKLIKCANDLGSVSVVIPQNWLFLLTYKKFRKPLLAKSKIDFIIRLGSGAFSQISGEVVKVILITISKYKIIEKSNFIGLDVSSLSKVEDKNKGLLNAQLLKINQKDQYNNPDSKIIMDKVDKSLPRLSSYADSVQGLMPSDRNRLVFQFWETGKVNEEDRFLHGSVKPNFEFSGLTQILKWSLFENIYNDIGGRLQGQKAWGRNGVAISPMSTMPRSRFLGNLFDGNVHTIIPKDKDNLCAITEFATSDSFIKEIRKIDQKLSVTCGTLIQVPFDLDYWKKITEDKYPKGLPKPYSDDPTQWLFHGHPLHTESPLQVAIARLMGYEWPAENDEEMELSEEAQEKIKVIKELSLPFDEDGIVCIPAVNGETSAADRIRANIMKLWGAEYNGNTLSELISQEGSNKKDLETYLHEDYFVQHCKLFKNRPFIWHIWDGRKDGFSALVNYHKLDKATLEKLIYTYLGHWIIQCDRKMQKNIGGADGLLSAAKKLKEKLVLILEGEPPYDLFIRWKSLAEQPIGWEPDINDGVRMNVYPFIQAGVLRKKFNIKWDKDRGKNPSGSDWGPERWNRYEDLDDQWKLKDEDGNIIPSLSNEVKREAKKVNE